MLLLFKGLRSREDTPGGHISLYLLAATCSLIGERMSYPYRAVRDVVGDGMDAPRDKDSGGEVSFALSAKSSEPFLFQIQLHRLTHRLLAPFSFINNIRKVIKGALHCVIRSNKCFANCFARHLPNRLRLCAGFVARKRGQATSRKNQQLCLSASEASRLLQPGCHPQAG